MTCMQCKQESVYDAAEHGNVKPIHKLSLNVLLCVCVSTGVCVCEQGCVCVVKV